MISELFIGCALVGVCSLVGWLVGGMALADARVDPEAGVAYSRFGAWLGAIAGCVAASGVLG